MDSGAGRSTGGGYAKNGRFTRGGAYETYREERGATLGMNYLVVRAFAVISKGSGAAARSRAQAADRDRLTKIYRSQQPAVLQSDV